MYWNFFVIFAFSILSECRSAPVNDTGVLWITQELSSPATVTLPETWEMMGKKLLKIIDEMSMYVQGNHANGFNVQNDESSGIGFPCGNIDDTQDFQKQNEAIKAMNLEIQRQKMENFLNWSGKDPPEIPIGSSVKEQQIESLKAIMKAAEDRRRAMAYVSMTKLLYPQCSEIALKQDDKSPKTANIWFENSLRPSFNMVINVTSAILNVHKSPYKASSYSASTVTPNSNINFTIVYLKGLEKKIDLSRRGHKLDNIQVLRADEARWMQWDLTKTISAWVHGGMSRNWITIKVAADQEHLPARDFFTINCSKITALNRKIEIGGKIGNLKDEEVPYFNLTMIEIPKEDIEYNNKEQKFINGVSTLKQKITGSDTSSSTEQKSKRKKNRETEDSTESVETI